MSVDAKSIAAALQASLATVQAAAAGVGDLASATPFQLAPVAAAVNTEISSLQTAIAEFDADIITDSIAGVVPAALPAPNVWPVLLNQAADSVLIAQLLTALGYLQRLALNLSQAAGAAGASA